MKILVTVKVTAQVFGKALHYFVCYTLVAQHIPQIQVVINDLAKMQVSCLSVCNFFVFFVSVKKCELYDFVKGVIMDTAQNRCITNNSLSFNITFMLKLDI